jgi:TolB protein
MAWSPDGTRIAFQGWDDTTPSRTGVYIGRASDGGDLVRVTRNPRVGGDLPMDFSRDATKIFFFRSIEGFPSIGDQLDGSLFAVNADGTDLHRVTPANMPVEAPGNSGGRLSSDGRWIVFTSSGVIWKIHPDGSAVTKVFEAPDGGLAITPTWSPDANFIMFGLDPAGSLATIDEAPPNGLYVIRADGTGLTPVITSDDWKREPEWIAPG